VHRRTDGWPDSRVSGEEDQGPAGQACRDRRARALPRRTGLHCGGGGPADRTGRQTEHRATRVQRDLLRLPVAGKQQRVGLRRPDRQRSLVRDHRRYRHAGVAIRPAPGRAGPRCERRPREDGSVHRRHAPDRHAAVRRAPDRRDRDHRSAHVPAGTRPRSHRRASDPREAVLMAVQTSQPFSPSPGSQAPTVERARTVRGRPLFDPPIVRRVIVDGFRKLDPRTLLRNPVIFVVEVVSVVVTIRIVADIASQGPIAFDTAIGLGLWFTVLFANFAEAMAEGRGKAQADSLRKTRADLVARRLTNDGREESIPASELRAGDLVVVSAGELIPGDGEIVEGIASVDESAITGESAPVIRESGGDRSAVTGGTRVLSDWIKVKITQ